MLLAVIQVLKGKRMLHHALSLNKASLHSKFKGNPTKADPSNPGQHHALTGDKRGSGGRGGEFLLSLQEYTVLVSYLRVLVYSSGYLPSPLSPLVIVCTLIYTADKRINLV